MTDISIDSKGSLPEILEIQIADTAESPPAIASMDTLLALTDEGWDIDEEVRTLKTAAEQKLRPRMEPPPLPRERSPNKGTSIPPIPSGPPKLGPPQPRRGPPPLPRPPSESPQSEGKVPDPFADASLVEMLIGRVRALGEGSDPIALARAQMELAIAHEMQGDGAPCVALAEAALKADPELTSAHALLRRRQHGRGTLRIMLSHLDQEIVHATKESGRAELFAERARLLDAMGERSEVVRPAWSQTLAHAPQHAAALQGLEAELATSATSPGASMELSDLWAAHLGQLADAYALDRPLAAWLHVERARILERLARTDAARGAFERALDLDPSVGPVRSAFVRYVSTRGDASALVQLLDQEAILETNPSRSARLELEAATLAGVRLADPVRAALLLERAAGRAPTTPSVDRRVLDDLIVLREAGGQWAEAARARRARLRFVTDPALLAYELRTLATLSERLGDLEAAVTDAQRALSLDTNDVTLVENLDRLLAATEKTDQRVALWLTEGARTEEGPRRARALLSAASLCEEKLGRRTDALRHLRTAWTASPGDPEVLDALTRLLRPGLSEPGEQEARALIELYAQACETSSDRDRKIAYLEKIALIWEDRVGDARRAARTYEEILKLEPNRRGAILGLAQASLRHGDERTYAAALLEEARLAESETDALALRTRAATVLARHDTARAQSIVAGVLAREPAHAAAQALSTRLHEEGGRWELAALSLQSRVEHASNDEKLPLYLALSQIEETRLKAPLKALATLQTARALDPRHPIPPASIARVLEAVGDATTLRTALEGLAEDAGTAEERASALVRAGEIDELRLGDDVRAASLYTKALLETPGDEMIVDHLERVLDRRLAGANKSSRPSSSLLSQKPASGQDALPGLTRDLCELLTKRIDTIESPNLRRQKTLELASLLIETGSDPARGKGLLEGILSEDPGYVPALRKLEAAARGSASWEALAALHERQAESFADTRARLGALWALAALEEWRLPATIDVRGTYHRILELDPFDANALEATIRCELPDALTGDPHSRKAVAVALRSLRKEAPDDSSAVALHLRLALLLEQLAADAGESQGIAACREALEMYLRVMDIDPLSVTATTGVVRLAARLHDVAGAVRAAMSMAELTTEPPVRARYLSGAAELLLGDGVDPSLGSPLDRTERAAGLLERALEADPDSISAADRLARLRLDHRQGPRVVETFRAAIRRARSPDAIVFLGNKIAAIARDDMRDLTLAIDAMRRVREAAPWDVPSLLTFAELCIAHRAWPEAVDALEAVTSTGRDAAPRLTALFALASIYEKVLSRPADSERVLRSALEIDPSSARALRGLLRHLTTHAGRETGGAAAGAEKICPLLSRLAEVEREPGQKSLLLVQLAELELSRDDTGAAERALIEAVAQNPGNTKAFARLSTVCRQPGGKTPEPVRYARALTSLVGRGAELGHVDARWLATLGQLEVQALNRLEEGIAHLQRAVDMAPTLYETRFELSTAHARSGAQAEASRLLTDLIAPDSRPLLQIADPGAALLLLETTLGAIQRPEEALVVSELRALSGELDEGRLAWLRGRRQMAASHPPGGLLDRDTLTSQVVPPEGRHPLLDVAIAIAGVESKVLRTDLAELGVSARDRVGRRAGNATRAVLDRVARTLGVSDIELVIATTLAHPRLIVNDEPWVIVPRGLVDGSEPAQVAAFARLGARVALGFPWLDELPPIHIQAYLLAAVRVVSPRYGQDDVEAPHADLVSTYEPLLAKSLSRKQRRQLEEVAARLTQGRQGLPAVEPFALALNRATLRAAYLVSGDLLATVDEIRQHDARLSQATERPGPRSLAAILEHPLAGDVCRFAIGPEAMGLRRRIGSVWT
jgi:tetratricopeptide (TPR) repeat protein